DQGASGLGGAREETLEGCWDHAAILNSITRSRRTDLQRLSPSWAMLSSRESYQQHPGSRRAATRQRGLLKRSPHRTRPFSCAARRVRLGERDHFIASRAFSFPAVPH